MEQVKEIKYTESTGKSKSLVIKIGIHYGRVIAGLIGYHKPQFSLIGDTVNTTSRVCSTGDYGKITISSQAYERVMECPYIFKEKRIEAKGKGILIVYEVNRK